MYQGAPPRSSLPAFDAVGRSCGRGGSRSRAIADRVSANICRDTATIAGERYTIADITAMVALGLGAVVGLTVDSGLANLTRWYGEVSARPSARA